MNLVDILHYLIADKEHVDHIQDLLDLQLEHPFTHTKTLDWSILESFFDEETVTEDVSVVGCHKIQFKSI